MAISATLELSDGNVVTNALLNTYTVLDLDYTLVRSMDQTGRPSSIAYMDSIKVTIRAAKEQTPHFHEWINKPDMVKSGSIVIYDSTGVLSSSIQDATGGTAPVDLDIATDAMDDMTEAAMNYGMDHASKYDSYQGDLFDEMSREELLQYIDSNKMDIKVDKTDSAEDLRRKIRNVKNGKDAGKGVGYDSHVRDAGYKTVDKLKDRTVDVTTSITDAVTKKLLEAGRTIKFKDAYCVSLREHFTNNPDSTGKLDNSYPWTLEIGIKPQTIEVQGWSAAGSMAGFAGEKITCF